MLSLVPSLRKNFESVTGGYQRQLQKERKTRGQKLQQLRLKRKALEDEFDKRRQAHEEVASSKRRALDAEVQQADQNLSEAKSALESAKKDAVAADAEHAAVLKLSRAADLKVLSARLQLVKILAWAGSLGYSLWVTYARSYPLLQ